VFAKEWRDLLSNRLLLGAVAFPALVFAAIPTGLVAFIQARDLDPNQLGQIQQYIANFPELSAKLAAQGFIVTNFMAYFLLIPAMVPMAIATQSVIGEKVARSLEPQLATPLEVSELLSGKTLAAAKSALADADCALGKVTRKHSAKKAGIVIGQKPAAGASLAEGAKVAVTVSSGKKR